MGFRLSKDVLDRAATSFFRLLDYVGIGEFVIGRRGKPTRLSISDNGYELLITSFKNRKEMKKRKLLGMEAIVENHLMEEEKRDSNMDQRFAIRLMYQRTKLLL